MYWNDPNPCISDHHCPWIASKCIGHRTYPAFVHFLICVTLLATYIAVVSIFALWFAFSNPIAVVSSVYPSFILHVYSHQQIQDENLPIHELFLAFDGIVFSLVVGSFCGWHLYLVS